MINLFDILLKLNTLRIKNVKFINIITVKLINLQQIKHKTSKFD